MKRSAAQPTRDSSKTIFDNGHYRKCDDCRPPRMAAVGLGWRNGGTCWALSIVAVRGLRFTSARWNGARCLTGAPKQRACSSAAQRCAGGTFARGEPVGAFDRVGRRFHLSKHFHLPIASDGRSTNQNSHRIFVPLQVLFRANNSDSFPVEQQLNIIA